MTATRGTHSTRRQRHESVNGRLAALRAVLDRFEAHVAEQPPAVADAVDLPGLRRVVRALVPLALDDPTFDVTSTIGDSGVAVRVHHCPDRGMTARIVTGAPGPQHRAADAAVAEPAGSHVVGELAELLRRRQMRPR
jgi:hypothetical protein